MINPRYLFFDLDGPILDVSEKYYLVYHDLVKSFGGMPLFKEDYWNAKRKKTTENDILESTGLTQKAEEYHKKRHQRIESADYLSYDKIWPGMLDVLNSLTSEIHLVLVTLRESRPALEEQLESLGLAPCFEKVLSGPGGADPEGRDAFKAKLVQEALADHTFEGWFIGDTETDIQAGKILGVKTAAVTFGIRTVDHLRAQNPDATLNSPDELIGWLDSLKRGWR